MEPVQGSQRKKSYHALLKTMSLDILHHHFINDSLINCAAKHYDSFGTLHHQMLTHYYKGTVSFHLCRYPDAIVSYEKAIEMAEKENNFLYLGLAYRNICAIYLNNYEFLKAQSSIERAIHYFEIGNYPEHLESARLKYADALLQAGDIEKADSVFSVVISHSQNYPLVYSAYKELAYIQDIKTKHDAEYVLNLYEIGGEYGYNCRDLCRMGYAYSFIDNKTSEAILLEAYRFAENALDTARITHHKYLIEKAHSNYKEALLLYENVTATQDSLVGLQLQQSLISSLNDVYRRNQEITKLKTNNTRIVALLIIGITSFTILVLCYLLAKSRKKRRELFENISETKRILQEREDDNLRLVKTMMLSKISVIEEAAQKYEETKNTREEEAAYRELLAKINTLRNDGNLYREIETALDTYHHGIISKVRQDYPDLTDYMFQLLLLFFAHIPQSTISLLRKSSESSIKTAKYRLRKLFRESGSPRKNDYLYLLDS